MWQSVRHWFCAGYEWDVGHFRGAQRPNVDCFKSTEFGLSEEKVGLFSWYLHLVLSNVLCFNNRSRVGFRVASWWFKGTSNGCLGLKVIINLLLWSFLCNLIDILSCQTSTLNLIEESILALTFFVDKYLYISNFERFLWMIIYLMYGVGRMRVMTHYQGSTRMWMRSWCIALVAFAVMSTLLCWGKPCLC